MNDLLYGDLTSTILGCYHRVFFKCSSHGLSEESLTKALMIELKKAGLRYREQVPVNHRYEEHKIGTGRIDMLVEGKVVLELKTLDTFDFKAQPALNQELVRQLLRGEYLDKRENVLFIGNSGTGKTHLATALAFAACQQGRGVRFFTATGLVTQLLERRQDRELERFNKQLERLELIVLDELGYRNQAMHQRQTE